jgi:hypothetical protein
VLHLSKQPLPAFSANVSTAGGHSTENDETLVQTLSGFKTAIFPDG